MHENLLACLTYVGRTYSTNNNNNNNNKKKNWKSPECDQIPNYWLKAFPATHSYITKFINTIIEEPKEMPDWLTTGIRN
jgi:hypothetical protein